MLSKLEQLSQDVKLLKARCTELESNINRTKAQQAAIKKVIEVNTGSLEMYKQAADILQYQRLEDVLTFVNEALEYIFYDEEYELKIELGESVSKTLTLLLYDRKKQLTTTLRKGNGRGVKAVICYMLYVYFCCEHKAEVLWQDETLVNISPLYVERLFSYVRMICETRSIAQVMITQDLRFLKYAHITYLVKHGNIRRIDNEE